MDKVINAKELRASLTRVLLEVKRGGTFTLIYRSQPVARIVPLAGSLPAPLADLRDDPIYRAPAVGRSRDGRSSEDHDLLLYRGSGR